MLKFYKNRWQWSESDISPVTGQFSVYWAIIDWAGINTNNNVWYLNWVTHSNSQLRALSSLQKPDDHFPPSRLTGEQLHSGVGVWVGLQLCSGRRAEERRDSTSYRERAEARRPRPDSAEPHKPGCGRQSPGRRNYSARSPALRPAVSPCLSLVLSAHQTGPGWLVRRTILQIVTDTTSTFVRFFTTRYKSNCWSPEFSDAIPIYNPNYIWLTTVGLLTGAVWVYPLRFCNSTSWHVNNKTSLMYLRPILRPSQALFTVETSSLSHSN